MKSKKVILLSFIFLVMSGSLHAENKLMISAIKGSINTLISADVMTEAYRRIGVEIAVEEYPAKRALFFANEGKVDGELFRIADMEIEYPNLIRVPVVINHLDAMVYTKSANFTLNGWASLKPYKIGIRRGVKFSERGTRGMDTVAVNSNKALFEILDAGKVDIIVISRTNGLAISNKFKKTDIKLLEAPIESYPMYHYLHSKNKHLLLRLQTALQAMEKEGLIKKIRTRFLSELIL